MANYANPLSQLALPPPVAELRRITRDKVAGHWGDFGPTIGGANVATDAIEKPAAKACYGDKIVDSYDNSS
jgi:hypothetical protein